jgi:hypothetical protein
LELAKHLFLQSPAVLAAAVQFVCKYLHFESPTRTIANDGKHFGGIQNSDFKTMCVRVRVALESATQPRETHKKKLALEAGTRDPLRNENCQDGMDLILVGSSNVGGLEWVGHNIVELQRICCRRLAARVTVRQYSLPSSTSGCIVDSHAVP